MDAIAPVLLGLFIIIGAAQLVFFVVMMWGICTGRASGCQGAGTDVGNEKNG